MFYFGTRHAANCGPDVIVEILGEDPFTELVMGPAYSEELWDDDWTVFLMKEIKGLQDKCESAKPMGMPVPAEYPPCSCIFELKDVWISGFKKALDIFEYNSVLVLVHKKTEENLLDVEKDMDTIRAVLPLCATPENSQKSATILDQQLREMRVNVAALKTLQRMSTLYFEYKLKLVNMTGDVKKKLGILPQFHSILLSPPKDPGSTEVYSKLQRFQDFVDGNPVGDMTSRVFGFLKLLYSKTIDGTLLQQEFGNFLEIDAIVRAGSVDAFKHFKSQFTIEIDQCIESINSFWITGKSVFGESVLQITRNGEQMIVDELTQEKTLTRVKYSFCALLGQISKKRDALVPLASIHHDWIVEKLAFNAKEWFDLVDIAHTLKFYCELKKIGFTSLTSGPNDGQDTQKLPAIAPTAEQQKSTDIKSSEINHTSALPSSYVETFLGSRDFYADVYRKFTEAEFKYEKSLQGSAFDSVSLENHFHLRKVAVKIFPMYDDELDVQKELRNIRKVQRNEHTVRLYGFVYSHQKYFDSVPIGYVMEYIPFSLQDVIHSRRESNKGQFAYEYSILQALKAMQSMASAFGALHEMRVMHGEIKPTNILVEFIDDQQLKIKICDFRTCGRIDERANGGEIVYLSPERLRSSRGVAYTLKADVYSMAITTWEMFHRNGKRPIVSSSAWLKPVRMLVERCWSQEAEKRPTMNELEELVKDLIEVVQQNKELSIVKIR